jgi:hypothetical protein
MAEASIMIVRYVSSVFMTEDSRWVAEWVWGLLLTVLTVLIHTLGLWMVRQTALRAISHSVLRRHPMAMSLTIISCVTLSAAALHGTEASLWALVYRFLNALPDYRTAMLYSLNAITSYGHANLQLQDRWHLMGAIEALNGWLLFGLSTAFLFAIIQRLSSLDDK